MPRRRGASRSDAARKGWETRRANERRRAAERERRSRAARKGWETRRRREREPEPPDYGDEYDEPLDDIPADEWELGFSYRGGGGGGGPASNVDVNLRVAREDGEAFGQREALGVLREFQQRLSTHPNDPVPEGYVLAAIDWQRPRWGTTWQSGEAADLVSFYAPMYTQTDNPDAWSMNRAGNVRLGSVKK